MCHGGTGLGKSSSAYAYKNSSYSDCKNKSCIDWAGYRLY